MTSARECNTIAEIQSGNKVQKTTPHFKLATHLQYLACPP